MTQVFLVRHAQPAHEWKDDRTKPLTDEGTADTEKVLQIFSTRQIDTVYSSPYTRSIQTIQSTANYFNKEIIMDERFREREKGLDGNNYGMFQKRWSDKNFHEEGGESIYMVQSRNIDALTDILENNEGKIVLIGTHGTALSSILHYYDPTFGCDSFLRIIDWMPYIVELDFEGQNCVKKIEHLYVQKEFKGSARADQSVQIK